jgi:hypothetical protein
MAKKGKQRSPFFEVKATKPQGRAGFTSLKAKFRFAFQPKATRKKQGVFFEAHRTFFP